MNDLQQKLLKGNKVMVADSISRDTFFYLREAIATKMTEGNPDLFIHISSPGGLVSAGLDIYDLLKFYTGKKIGIVTSTASSMAAVILQACDWRTATPHSQVMIHHVNSGDVSLDTIRNEEKMRKFIDGLESSQQKIYQILTSRTGKALEEIRKTCELEVPMIGSEALAYGLLDQIIENESQIDFPKK